MKANWKNRYAQAEDERVGRELDRYIELGIRLTCLAFNQTEGVGRVKIERARKRINEMIEKDFNCGAARFSTERRLNVDHAVQRCFEAYEAIMRRGRKEEKT